MNRIKVPVEPQTSECTNDNLTESSDLNFDFCDDNICVPLHKHRPRQYAEETEIEQDLI